VKRTNFAICERHGLLIALRSGRIVVATARLHRLLGESIYQRYCTVFRYDTETSPGPSAIEIERFLRTDAGSQAAMKRKASA